MDTDLKKSIITTAKRLGIDATDLATVMSYETAGTFDPWKKGPTTQWGQHRGLIQWGEPQRKKYGVYEGMPVDAQVNAAGEYLKDAGVRPGMGILDVYSAINAGGVGRYNRSDANNGGAPGTVRDKVEKQMGPHREKALSLLGGMSVPQQIANNSSSPVSVAAGEQAPTLPSPINVGDRPVAAMGSMSPQPQPQTASVPDSIMAAATAPLQTDKMGAMFSAMMQPQQQQLPQMAPVRGPSPEQANALSSLIAALKQQRMV